AIAKTNGGIEKLLERVRLGDRVVVHQPEPIRACGVRVLDPAMEAARASDVGRQREHLNLWMLAREHLHRAVGGGVVDDEDVFWGTALDAERGEAAAEHLAAVVGNNNGAHRAHGASSVTLRSR